MSGRVAPELAEGAAEPLDDATDSIISAEQGGYGDAPASAVAINKSIAEGRWEYVIVMRATHIADLSEDQRGRSLRRVIALLHSAGLETQTFMGATGDNVFVKIRAPYARLCAEAARIDYYLQLDPPAARQRMELGGPRRKPVRLLDEHLQSPYDPYDYIYARYSSAPHLQDLYTKFPPFGVFDHCDRLRLVLSIMRAPRTVSPPGAGLRLEDMVANRSIVAFYPLQNKLAAYQLMERMPLLPWPLWSVPLHRDNDAELPGIRTLYGERIGVYFAFLSHYTLWLCISAALGASVYVANFLFGEAEIWGSIGFGTFMMLWAVLFQDSWVREQRRLAMMWGTTGFEEVEQLRPEYQGEPTPSPVDGTPSRYFSPTRAVLRRAFSYSVIATAIGVVLISLAAILVLRLYLTEVRPVTIMGVEVGAGIAGSINAIVIMILNNLYSRVAVRLNDLENHRTRTEYEDHLIVKVFCFQFANNFSSLFYIAFVKKYVRIFARDTTCVNNDCMSEMYAVTRSDDRHLAPAHQLHDSTAQLASLLLTTLVVNNAMELGLPLLKRKWRGRAHTRRVRRVGEQDRQAEQAMMGGLSQPARRRASMAPASAAPYGPGGMAVDDLGDLDTWPEDADGGARRCRCCRRRRRRRLCCGRRQPRTKATLSEEAKADGPVGSAVHAESSSDDESADEADRGPRMYSPAEEEFRLQTYANTIDDFMELAIQYGYVTMFVVAFPLAPLLALGNNIVEARVDLRKLKREFRRPAPDSAEDIGMWMGVFNVISNLAVFTNIALLVLEADIVQDLSLELKLVVFAAVEHAIWMLRYVLSTFPTMPPSVVMQRKRAAFIVQKLIDEIPDEDDELDVAAEQSSVLNMNVNPMDPEMVAKIPKTGWRLF